MVKLLYLSLAAGVLLLGATVGSILKWRCRETGSLCLRETWMTAVLGIMLLALGFVFPALKLTDPSAAGTDSQSYWFVILFSLACHLMGDFALLFTFVKRTVLYEDRVLACSAFGRQTQIRWEDVVRVDKPVTKSCYILTDRDGDTIQVGGDNKASRQFVDFAKAKIKTASGANLLHQVEHRLSGRHL